MLKHEAKAKFDSAKAQAVGALQLALEKIKSQEFKEDKNWGHVGDMVRNAEEAQQITDRLYGWGEYAENGDDSEDPDPVCPHCNNPKCDGDSCLDRRKKAR